MITIDPIKRPPRKSSAIDKDEIMKEVDQKFSNLVEGAPEKLDTIKELADAIENLPNLDNYATKEALDSNTQSLKDLIIKNSDEVSIGITVDAKYVMTDGTVMSGTTLYAIYHIEVEAGTEVKFTCYSTKDLSVIAQVNQDGTYTPIIKADSKRGVHTYSYITKRDMTIALSGRIGSTSTEPRELVLTKFVNTINLLQEIGKDKNSAMSQKAVTDAILKSELENFDGYYTTGGSVGFPSDNYLKEAGVYIRKENHEHSRGEILFVSTSSDKSKIYQYKIHIENNGSVKKIARTYENEVWSSWDKDENVRLCLPVLSNTIPIKITDESIEFNGVYMYKEDGSRIHINATTELDIEKNVSKVVYDMKTGKLDNVEASSIFANMPVLAYITRESGSLKIINVLINSSNYTINGVNVLKNAMNVQQSKNIYNPSKIKYIPHRGIRNSEIPENTTYSVMFASLYGLDYSECDVRYTSDRVGVIMHDTTINRTMYNADMSEISEDVTIADNSFDELSTYVYKSTNPIYRTRLQTIREYIDACAQWNVCPIIQGSMSDDDLSYCMQRLGDNWICYGGDFSKVRNYSKHVLCLTSASYNSVDAMINALSTIGGNVGLSRLSNSKLTDEYISACKENGWEIMASYAYEHASIPDAIRRGATIVLSDNVGKNTNRVLVSSLKRWDQFNHNVVVENGKLIVSANQNVSYTIHKKGSYKIYAMFSGEGSIKLPDYNHAGIYGNIDFPMENDVFTYTFSMLEDNAFDINITTSSELTIEKLIIFYEASNSDVSEYTTKADVSAAINQAIINTLNTEV